MSNNKHSGVFGKGYYIALVLCAAAIGISGYMYYQNANDTEPVLQEPEIQATVPAAVTGEDVPVLVTKPQESDATEATQAPTQAPKSNRTLKTTAPVSGETVAGYAMDCLSYNQTTRDWRVHDGVDIAADEGTQVVAAAAGVVYTTYTDDLMGATVVIRHEGGYMTHYSSLAEELYVSAGDEVSMGQAIGCVGSSALIENTMAPHVHFSVTYQDAAMDPAEFLALGE